MIRASAVIESAFAERRQREWDALDHLARRASARGIRTLSPQEVARVSPLYRDVCSDLSRAQAARYSAPLVEYLQGLAAAGHTLVYGSGVSNDAARRFAVPNFDASSPSRRTSRLRAAVEAFPRAVRKRWRAMSIAFLLFFVPFAIGLFMAYRDPSFAFRIVPESSLKPLTEAYLHGFNDGRAPGEGAAMAGFYVNNNVGIALRCFALGVFGGLGSAFYLLQNGLSIGAVLGYVASQGAGDNILTFVVGHSAFELGAIVIAGGAGLSLGWSIVAPGDRTRIASLQSTAREVVVIVCGAAVMLLIAASIEAFWSASSVHYIVKRSIGGTFLVLVTLYLFIAGRGTDARASARENEIAAR
jgi:uncharacterized membrane protein SpoIIM required for sporulation